MYPSATVFSAHPRSATGRRRVDSVGECRENRLNNPGGIVTGERAHSAGEQSTNGRRGRNDAARLLARPGFEIQAMRTWQGSTASPQIMPFEILHDSSKSIESEQLVLEAMMFNSEAPRIIGYDRRMRFPLTATGISLCKSAAEPSLQVADVVARAAAYVLRSSLAKDGDVFVNELTNTRALGGDW